MWLSFKIMNFRSNLNSVRVKMPGDTAVEAPVGDNDKKIDEPVTKRKEKRCKKEITFWRKIVGMKCFFQKVKTDKEAIVEEEKEAEATEEKKDEEKVRSKSSSLTSPTSSANSPTYNQRPQHRHPHQVTTPHLLLLITTRPERQRTKERRPPPQRNLEFTRKTLRKIWWAPLKTKLLLVSPIFPSHP